MTKESWKTSDIPEGFFLPDLCNAVAVVYLLVVSEGLVVTLTLMESGLEHFSWQRFGLVSLFVQWVALVSVAMLCQMRRWLARIPVATASAASLLIVQLVTLIVGMISDQIRPSPGAGTDWFWLWRNALVSALISALALRYFYVQSQWRLQAQAELRARLSALQANIRPHFFFNTLNTVASLIVIDPDKAETMLLDLAQLFRAVMKNDGQPATLAAEITLGQRYLAIEQTRLGQRLQVSWNLPEQLPALRLPALILQPLLENAIYHGIQPLRAGGYIRVDLCHEERGWLLTVSNSRGAESDHKGNGIALANIRARLQVMYAETARLETQALEQSYEARLIIPDSTGGEKR